MYRLNSKALLLVSSLAPNSLKQTVLKGEMTKRKGFSCWVRSVLATEQHVWREEICYLGLALIRMSVTNTYKDHSPRGRTVFNATCSDG